MADAPIDAVGGAEAGTRVRQHLAIHEARAGRDSGEIAARPAGAHRGPGHVRGVVAAGLSAVIIRVLALVHRRVEVGITGEEVAAAQELPAHRLVTRIRGHRVGGVVHAGVENPDHDAGAIVPELLANAGKQNVVLRA